MSRNFLFSCENWVELLTCHDFQISTFFEITIIAMPYKMRRNENADRHYKKKKKKGM